MTGSIMRPMARAVLAVQAMAAVALAGCGMGGPQPILYVLGSAPAPEESRRPALGLPVVALRRVRVPDYLDTTDLMWRDGSKLEPSPAGRWGERLSLGVTRTLAADCASRLPQFWVTTTPTGQAQRELLVDVESFEIRRDKTVVLVADWRLIDSATGNALASEQRSVVEKLDGEGDAAAVTAMSRALDDLAAGIAAAVAKGGRSGQQ